MFGVVLFAVFANYLIVSNSGKYIREDKVCGAIIVPGARVFADGKISAVYRMRLDKAALIYRQGKAGRIIVSADNRKSHNFETNAGRVYLTGKGIPEKNIVSDGRGFATLDSMYRAKYVYGESDMIIVTQKYHLYRSIFVARNLGINAFGASAEDVSGVHLFHVREFFARVKSFVLVKTFQWNVFPGSDLNSLAR